MLINTKSITGRCQYSRIQVGWVIIRISCIQWCDIGLAFSIGHVQETHECRRSLQDLKQLDPVSLKLHQEFIRL